MNTSGLPPESMYLTTSLITWIIKNSKESPKIYLFGVGGCVLPSLGIEQLM